MENGKAVILLKKDKYVNCKNNANIMQIVNGFLMEYSFILYIPIAENIAMTGIIGRAKRICLFEINIRNRHEENSQERHNELYLFLC